MVEITAEEAGSDTQYLTSRTMIKPSMDVHSRQDRIKQFGIDCGDGLDWGTNWTVGGEYTKMLTFQNVTTQNIKITYELPASCYFYMKFPEPITLAPGVSKSISVSFRPVTGADHMDYVTVNTQVSNSTTSVVSSGRFIVPVRASIAKLSAFLTPVVDMGECVVGETSSETVTLANEGGTDLYYRWVLHPAADDFVGPTGKCVGTPGTPIPIDIASPEGHLAPNAPPLQIPISLLPQYAHSLTFRAHCLISSFSIPSTATPSSPGLQILTTTLHARCVCPHIHISQTTVDFGAVVGGSTLAHTITLTNRTRATTSWALQRSLDDMDCAYTLSPTSGSLPPLGQVQVQVVYHPQSAHVEHNEAYRLLVPGYRASPPTLHLLARAVMAPVRVDKHEIDFGSVALPAPSLPGQVASTSAIARAVVTLVNSAPVPVPFAVLVGAQHGQAPYSPQGRTPSSSTSSSSNSSSSTSSSSFSSHVFSISPSCGVLPPLLSTTITITFAPTAPLNFYTRLFILLHRQEPLLIDVVGTAHTSSSRPLPLLPAHIHAHRLRTNIHPLLPLLPPLPLLALARAKPRVFAAVTAALANVPTYTAPADPPPLDLAQLPHSLRVLATDPDTPYEHTFPSSYAQLFEASQHELATLSHSIIDLTHTTASVTLSSRSQFKLAVHWAHPNSIRVEPSTTELPPGASASFTVHYTGTSEMDLLQLVAHCHPFHQRTFRLAHTQALTPPSSLSLVAFRALQSPHSYSSPAVITPSSLAFGAVLDASYQSFTITNKGTSELLFRIPQDSPVFTALPSTGMLKPGAVAVIAVRCAAPSNHSPSISTSTSTSASASISTSTSPSPSPSTSTHDLRIILNSHEQTTIRLSALHPSPVASLPQHTLYLPPACPGTRSTRTLRIRNPHRAPMQYRVEGTARASIVPRCGVIPPAHHADVQVCCVPKAEGIVTDVATIYTSFAQAVPERANEDELLSSQQLAIARGVSQGGGALPVFSPSSTTSTSTSTSTSSSTFSSTSTSTSTFSSRRQSAVSAPTPAPSTKASAQESTLRQQLRAALREVPEDASIEHKQLLHRARGVSTSERYISSLPPRGSPKTTQEHVTELTICCTGQRGAVTVSHDSTVGPAGEIDMGAAQTGLAVTSTLKLLNRSDVDVAYTLHIQQQHSETGTRPPSAAINILELSASPSEGTIAARSARALAFTFSPRSCGVRRYTVTVTAGDTTACAFELIARGAAPTLCIRGVTALTSGRPDTSLACTSWEFISADAINAHLLRPQHCDIIDDAFDALTALARQAKITPPPSPPTSAHVAMVPVLFPSRPLHPEDPVMSSYVIELHNPSDVECSWCIAPPADTSNPWDAGQPSQLETYTHKVMDAQLFAVHPSAGALPPGRSMSVLVSYLHAWQGHHRTPLVLRAGRCQPVGLLLIAHTTPPLPSLLAQPRCFNDGTALLRLAASATTHISAAALAELLVPPGQPRVLWQALLCPQPTRPLVPLLHTFTSPAHTHALPPPSLPSLPSLSSLSSSSSSSPSSLAESSNPVSILINMLEHLLPRPNTPLPTAVTATISNPSPLPVLACIQPGPFFHAPFAALPVTLDTPLVLLPPHSSFDLPLRVYTHTPTHILSLLTISQIPLPRDLSSLPSLHSTCVCASIDCMHARALPPALITEMPDMVRTALFAPSLRAASIPFTLQLPTFLSHTLVHTHTHDPSLPLPALPPALSLSLLAPSPSSLRGLKALSQQHRTFMHSLQSKHVYLPAYTHTYDAEHTPLPTPFPSTILALAPPCLPPSLPPLSSLSPPCPFISLSTNTLTTHRLCISPSPSPFSLPHIHPDHVSNDAPASTIDTLCIRVVMITNPSSVPIRVNAQGVNVTQITQITTTPTQLGTELPPKPANTRATTQGSSTSETTTPTMTMMKERERKEEEYARENNVEVKEGEEASTQTSGEITSLRFCAHTPSQPSLIPWPSQLTLSPGESAPVLLYIHAGTTPTLFSLTPTFTVTPLGPHTPPSIRPSAVGPRSASTQAGESNATALYCQQRPTAFGYTFQDNMCELSADAACGGIDEVDAVRRAANAMFVGHVRVNGWVHHDE